MPVTKLFEYKNNQVVRIPEEFRFEENEVIIHKAGDAVVLAPVHHSYINMIQGLNMFSDDLLSEERLQLPSDRQW